MSVESSYLEQWSRSVRPVESTIDADEDEKELETDYESLYQEACAALLCACLTRGTHHLTIKKRAKEMWAARDALIGRKGTLP